MLDIIKLGIVLSPPKILLDISKWKQFDKYMIFFAQNYILYIVKIPQNRILIN